MKHTIKRPIHIALCMASLIFGACTKDFLEIKPDKAQVVPATLKDLQALLDNTDVMNTGMPALPELGSDNYFLTPASFQSISATYLRNAYIWAGDVYEGNDDIDDWNFRYRQIFYANMVLEGLEKSTDKDKASKTWKEMKGSALFYRAWAYYQLAQSFCKPFDPSTANRDLGIPLRTEPDINLTSKRATVKETYDQIIADLEEGIALLPNETTVKTRPSKAAGEAMLSRTFLQMGDYNKSLEHATKGLALYSTLTDYNAINATATYPFQRFNPEVIFHATMYNATNFTASRLNVDSTLLKTYHADDLRRPLFFNNANGMIGFKGSYDGSTKLFSGISTSELYLTAAECYARKGDVDEALDLINKLLVKRFKSGLFTGVASGSPHDVLELVLMERRKELLFRGLRWSDLRRLNKDPEFQTTLRRALNGTEYTLPPNDPRYVWPIPDIVIFLSGIEQNPR